jgi:hypothetical protein
MDTLGYCSKCLIFQDHSGMPVCTADRSTGTQQAMLIEQRICF